MLIGELATATGVSTTTLRFYESDGLLPEPARTAAGYRDYTTSAVTRVTFIRQAQAAGLTLAQIREILDIRDGGLPPCQHVADLVDHRLDEITQRLRELEDTRRELLALRQRLDRLAPANCADETICAAIPSSPSPATE
jgi:DNA-binding transcriptional MerR regulator